MTKPYEEIIEQHGTGTKFVVRTFEDSVDEDELVWHRDERDRKIKVLSDTGWQIQFDDELPISINRVTEIPKMVYHRLIKGDGALVIEIEEI